VKLSATATTTAETAEPVLDLNPRMGLTSSRPAHSVLRFERVGNRLRRQERAMEPAPPRPSGLEDNHAKAEATRRRP
jgi:hypothetical protein